MTKFKAFLIIHTVKTALSIAIHDAVLKIQNSRYLRNFL